MTLLELIIATSMLAMLLTSVSIVIRGVRASWDAHEADYVRIEAAHSTLRHIVRTIRAAEAVTAVTPETNNSGSLSVRMPNGDTLVWAHDAVNNRVNYGVTAASNLLASEITGLRFRSRRADATTAAATPGDTQCLQIEVTVQLPREANGQRIVTSWAWVRSW